MENQYINPFTNLPSNYQNYQPDQTNGNSDNSFNGLSNISIGLGDSAIYLDQQQGLWLGSVDFNKALFGIDIDGNVYLRNPSTGDLYAFLTDTGFVFYGDTPITFKKNPGVGGSDGIEGVASNGHFVVASDNNNQFDLFGSNGLLLQANAANITLQAYQDIKLGVLHGAIYLYSHSFVIGANTGIVDLGGGVAGITCGSGTKTAIVETSEGYKALYCTESPEVWFMDFADSKELIDPLFLEVTEGKIKTIKCEDGSIQVWRRRKGFNNTRFEDKTKEQFEKNLSFWDTPNRL